MRAIVPRGDGRPIPDGRDNRARLLGASALGDGGLEGDVIRQIPVGFDQLELARVGVVDDKETLVGYEANRAAKVEVDPLVVVSATDRRAASAARGAVVVVALPAARALHVGTRPTIVADESASHRGSVERALAVDAAVEDVGVVEALVRLAAVHRLVGQRRLGIDEVVFVIRVECQHRARAARPVDSAPVGGSVVDDGANEDVAAQAATQHLHHPVEAELLHGLLRLLLHWLVHITHGRDTWL